MTVTVSERTRLEELIIHEANGQRSRETLTILAASRHELDLGDVVELSGTSVIKQLSGGTTYGVCITPKIEGLVSASVFLDIATKPTDTDTITIGTKTYTFDTSLGSADGDVFIGSAVANSVENLVAAINHTVGSGTEWAAATTKNTDVYAVPISASRIQLIALLPGSAGNSIASTETLTDTTDAFTAATLLGGQGAPNIECVVLARDCEVVQGALDVGGGVAATVYTDLTTLGIINKNRVVPATADTQGT